MDHAKKEVLDRALENLRKLNILPSYSLTKAFYLSVIFYLTIIVNFSQIVNLVKNLLMNILKFNFEITALFIFFCLFYFISGSQLPIYYILRSKKPTKGAKNYMVFFCTSMVVMISIYSVNSELKAYNGFLKIFPIINIIHSVLILIFLALGFIYYDNFVEEKINKKKMALDFSFILLIFFLLKYRYDLDWATLDSLAITYSLLGSDILSHVIKIKDASKD